MTDVIQHENRNALLALIFLVVGIAVFVFSFIGEYKSLQPIHGIESVKLVNGTKIISFQEMKVTMKIKVILEFDEKDLGQEWFNVDNLKLLLYSKAKTSTNLLKIVTYEKIDTAFTDITKDRGVTEDEKNEVWNFLAERGLEIKYNLRENGIYLRKHQYTNNNK